MFRDVLSGLSFLAEVRAVGCQVFVFLGRVLAAEYLVSMWEASELVDDVAVQFGELCDGAEGFLKGW